MAAVVCRNMTAWYGHETDKCWGEVKNILMRELVIGVPMTHVSENHCCVVVHRGINFPSSGSVATSIECVRTAHFNTKIMPRIKTMWFDGEMTGKHNSCRGMRWSLQESEWKSNSNHVDDMTRLWRLKLESKETPTPVMKATGRRRDIDETLMQHDVRASREAVGTGSPAKGSSIQKAEPKPLHAQHSSTLGKHSRRACCDARPSRIRLTNGKSESHGTVRRLPEMASSWRVRVNSGGSGCAGSTARVDGWIIKDRVDIEARGRPLATVQYVRHAQESRSRMWQDLTTEGSIQEARHENETQLKSEDTILNRTPKRKRTRQAETGETTRERRARKGVAMSHSDQV